MGADTAGKHPTTIFQHVPQSFPARFQLHAMENMPDRDEDQPDVGLEDKDDWKGKTRASEPASAVITREWIGREGKAETEGVEFAGYEWF